MTHFIPAYFCNAENCIVIAEGELDHRGIFKAMALGMPPVESREDSLAATKACLPCISMTSRMLHAYPAVLATDTASLHAVKQPLHIQLGCHHT